MSDSPKLAPSVGARRLGRFFPLAILIVLVQSCGRGDSSAMLGPQVNPLDLATVVLTPQAVTLSTGGSNQFVATAILPDSTTIVPDVTWSATGGTITPTGVFTASAAPGSYQVSAQIKGHDRKGTAPVTVAAATLTSMTMSPSFASLAEGATQQFTVSGVWSDGSTAAPSVTYSATGGTITAGGSYTAGTAPGTFRVIATQQGGTLADTSTVTIAAPAAILLQMVMTPATLSLAPGGTGQFAVAGSWSDGSSAAPAVTYAATGGTITAGGLYTAGSTAGTFRVIATQQGGTKADTSAVTITAPVVTMTQMVMSPPSMSLAPGGTAQFSVTATWSDGSTSSPAVTYSATGGTITAGGLYTAGSTAGSFRVIAAQQGGTKADTSAVTVTAANTNGLVVNAGVGQTISLGTAAAINATVSTTNAGPVRMFWQKISGPGSATFSHASFNSSFEDGTINEWIGDGGGVQNGIGPYVDNSRSHSGGYSWAAYNGGGDYQAKLIRFRFDYLAGAYYSAWYYWPSSYLLYGSGYGVNILQFKERQSPYNPVFIVVAQGSTDGSQLDDLYLYDWHTGQAWTGSPNPVRVPKDQWFNITVFQTPSQSGAVAGAASTSPGGTTGSGEIAVWVNGVLSWDVKGQNTMGAATNNFQGGTSMAWGIGNYSSPTLTGKTVWIDDAYVADASVDPRTTSVTFSAVGTYVLRLTAYDGSQVGSSDIQVVVK